MKQTQDTWCQNVLKPSKETHKKQLHHNHYTIITTFKYILKKFPYEICVTELVPALSSQLLPQQALSSPITSELLVGALPVVPMESLASPVTSERETQPQTQAVSGQDPHSVMSDQCVEASPLHSDPEDTPLLCSSPRIQDSGTSASASFSPSAGPQMTLPGSETSPFIASQSCTEPQVQYQVPHQLQVSQALFAQNQVQIQSSVSQPLPQIQASVSQLQVQTAVSQPQSSVHSSDHSSPSPLHVSVSVPRQQPDPTAVPAVSKGGDDSAVQQHTQNSEFNCCLIQVWLNTTLTFSHHCCYLVLGDHGLHHHHCYQSQQLPWPWRVKRLLSMSIHPLLQPRLPWLPVPQRPESVPPSR